MQEYIIYPYIGVGELKFGMSGAEVHAIIGMPDRKKKSRFSNEVTEYWKDNGLQLVFSDQNYSLVEISLYPNLKSSLNGIDIFSESGKNIYKKLCEIDGDPRQTVGVTLLLKLGVAMTGFLNDDADDKSVTAFSVGRWNKEDPELLPIK